MITFADENLSNDQEMKYEYKQAGNRQYIVSISNGEELMGTLTAFCQERNITLGTISRWR